jgi:hypothetical protein
VFDPPGGQPQQAAPVGLVDELVLAVVGGGQEHVRVVEHR